MEIACKDISADVLHATGKLRATVAGPSASQHLIPLLPMFFARYPDIQLELDLSEGAKPLIAKRFDVGIRVGVLVDAAFVIRDVAGFAV